MSDPADEATERGKGISERIRNAMAHRGITKAALASAIDELPRRLYKRIALGLAGGRDALPRIAYALGVPLEWLESNTNEPSWAKHTTPISRKKAAKQEQSPVIPIADLHWQTYADWSREFNEVWNTYLTNQTDDRDKKVAALPELPQTLQRSTATRDGVHRLSVRQIAALSEALGVFAPVAQIMDYGRRHEANFRNDFISDLTATASLISRQDWKSALEDIDRQREQWRSPRGEAYDLCLAALDLADKRPQAFARRKAFDASDVPVVRAAFEKMKDHREASGPRRVPDAPPPPGTFRILFESLLELRDSYEMKDTTWHAIQEILTTLFACKLPNEPSTTFIEAVRWHRRLWGAKFRRSLPATRSPTDNDPAVRRHNLWLHFCGAVRRQSEAETLYAHRGLTSSELLVDLGHLTQLELVRPLNNGYLLWLEPWTNTDEWKQRRRDRVEAVEKWGIGHKSA